MTKKQRVFRLIKSELERGLTLEQLLSMGDPKDGRCYDFASVACMQLGISNRETVARYVRSYKEKQKEATIVRPDTGFGKFTLIG